MNRVKAVKNKGYTVINNGFLRDPGLSLKAKGLMAMVMSLPEDWDFTISGIVSIIKEEKTAVYSAIDELMKSGYCKRERVQGGNGLFAGYEYEFIEIPYSDFPCTDFPYTENRKQINKEEINKEEINEISLSDGINSHLERSPLKGDVEKSSKKQKPTKGQKKEVEEGDPAADPTKMVLKKFHKLTEMFGLDYTYPRSTAAWNIVHRGIRNTLLKEITNTKGSTEDNEKTINEFFNKIYVMVTKRVFPFESPEKIDLHNIVSATFIAKVQNFHIDEHKKICYEGVVFHVARTDTNGIKYNDNGLALTAKGGVKFDMGKSMYDYSDPKDATNFSIIKNSIKKKLEEK